MPKRLKKWTRTRTGCYTCRDRRIKCDERKPICRRCAIGSHRCVFPGSDAPSQPVDTEAPATGRKTTSYDAIDDGSDSDDSLSEVFARAAGADTSPSLGLVQTRHRYDSIAGRFQAAFVNTPPWLQTCELPMNIYDGLYTSPETSPFPLFRTPRPIHDDLIPFFLSYHRQNINYGRYFWYSDPHQFIKESLLDLTKQSESLQYAVAAFSALIYSIQVDQRMKRFTFLFYSKAIQELRQAINSSSINSEASMCTTVATILELASIERVIADVVKCFRHVSGAAQIFQTQTNATQLCSSSLGRHLFKWYSLIEDECCLLLSCRGALPPTWRQEDFRIRKLIAASEYPLLSKDELRLRILDDVLQATLDIITAMADGLSTVPELNRATGDRRAEIIAHLESTMIYIINYVQSLRNSQLVMPLIQTFEVGFPWKSKHSTCCPELPFPPFRFAYPPAGMIFICLEAIRLYVTAVLYPPIKAAGIEIERLEYESKFNEFHALEMCRGYAAIEDEFGGDLTYLLACFRPLSVAGFALPKDLRRWYWYKMAHFERLAPTYVEPVRRYVSVLWGIPELLTMSFENLLPKEKGIMVLTPDDIGAAASVVLIASDSGTSGETDGDDGSDQ